MCDIESFHTNGISVLVEENVQEIINFISTAQFFRRKVRERNGSW
jgi:hypothetical protein